jgi:hypothetical protein
MNHSRHNVILRCLFHRPQIRVAEPAPPHADPPNSLLSQPNRVANETLHNLCSPKNEAGSNVADLKTTTMSMFAAKPVSSTCTAPTLHSAAPEKMIIQMLTPIADNAPKRILKIQVFVDTVFHKLYELDRCRPPPGKVAALHFGGVYLEAKKAPRDYNMKSMDLIELSFIEEKEVSAASHACSDTTSAKGEKANVSKADEALTAAAVTNKMLATDAKAAEEQLIPEAKVKKPAASITEQAVLREQRGAAAREMKAREKQAHLANELKRVDARQAEKAANREKALQRAAERQLAKVAAKVGVSGLETVECCCPGGEAGGGSDRGGQAKTRGSRHPGFRRCREAVLLVCEQAGLKQREDQRLAVEANKNAEERLAVEAKVTDELLAAETKAKKGKVEQQNGAEKVAKRQAAEKENIVLQLAAEAEWKKKTEEMPEQKPAWKICSVCGKSKADGVKIFKCSRCEKRRYCSRE